MHTIIPPFPRYHLFLDENQLGKLRRWPSVCHWMDPNIWAVRVKVKLSAETDVWQLFPCVTLKVSGKKGATFDRWNSNSCQLRLWLKIIPLLIWNFFWLNHNFKVKWFHYVQLQLWLSLGNQAGGGGLLLFLSHFKTNTLRTAAFVCGYKCLQAGFFGDEASTEHLLSPVPQRHLPGGIDFGANAVRNAAFL